MEEERQLVTSCLQWLRSGQWAWQWAGLTWSKQVQHQPGQRLLQVELQQLDGLQAVGLLLVSRPPAAVLEESEIGAAAHPGEELDATSTSTLSIKLPYSRQDKHLVNRVWFFLQKTKTMKNINVNKV